MKKLTIITIILVSSLCVKAQLFSEIQQINGKWYLELVNNKHIKLKSLKILSTKDVVTIDTVSVKQSVVNFLDSSSNIIVITEDSLVSEIKNDTFNSYFQLRINDSINTRYFPWGQFNKNQQESVVFIDSATIHKGGYNAENPPNRYDYCGRGFPSLGKPNKREDAFVIVKGKFYRSAFVEAITLKNIKFKKTDAWRVEDGSDTLCTDSTGSFVFACWPI